jgi:hypothetical protein
MTSAIDRGRHTFDVQMFEPASAGTSVSLT